MSDKNKSKGNQREATGIARAIREHAATTRPLSGQELDQRERRNRLPQWGAMIFSALSIGLSLLALSISRDQTRLAQRAYVYLDRIEFKVIDRVLPPEQAKNVTIFNAYNNTKKVVAVTFYATNSGNAPADNLRGLIDCHVLRMNTPPAVDPFTLFRWNDATATRQVIGPKQTLDIGACDLEAEDILNAHTGTVRRSLMGEIRYRDRVDPDALHITRFSRELVVLNRELNSFAADTRAVGQHNCADSDCPSGQQQ